MNKFLRVLFINYPIFLALSALSLAHLMLGAAKVLVRDITKLTGRGE